MSENIFVLNESSSEYSTSSDENEDDNIVLNNEFMNYTPVQEYERNRNKLFTKDIEKRIIVVDSHNVHQDSSFNSSNYTIKFKNNSNNEDTNINIHNNVIGFRLLKANIRSPPYNVNSTNNVIYYTIDDTEYYVTINPGLYTLSELASAFAFSNTSNSSRAHHVIYRDTNGSIFTNGIFTDGNSSRIEYLNSTAPTSNGRGISFKFANDSSDEEFTIKWNKNNVTRGAAKLFGFIPKETTSSSNVLFSDKTPDLSSHYVDLVIPEIPQIACKHNSYGNDIIERIPLTSFHGEYVYYKDDYDISVNYFFPIKLHQLTIKLFSDNKELYDSNDSDNNFEFEITLVKNLNLLK